MVTQSDIARRVGIDVSTVSKILSKTRGPVFRPDTIAAVFKVARDMGYNIARPTKHSLQRRLDELETYLRALVPKDLANTALARDLGIHAHAVERLKELLYPMEVNRARAKGQLRKVSPLRGSATGTVRGASPTVSPAQSQQRSSGLAAQV